MKRLILSLCCLWTALSYAQSENQVYKGFLHNDEYGVYLRINLYEQDIIIPGQELLGTLPGFLGKDNNSFCWPIVSAEVKGKKATLQMVNDYGSEDLEATLTRQNDSIFVLRQGKGSTIKVPSNGKWQKLPPILPFKRK